MTWKQRLYRLLILLGIFAGVSLVLLLTGINCPIRYFTGFSCPGCGMTRACLALVFGPNDLGERLRLAAQYHPMAFVVPPLLLYAIWGKRPLFGSEKRELAAMYAVCALMLVTYGVRLALHDPVLSVDWQDGQIARVLHALRGGAGF